MSYEVDVLAVGEESKSGDAIALRYGDFRHRTLYKVVVVDGGFTKNGENLVQLISTVYGTSIVDLVISTHPDSDHSAGLKVVLEELTVRELWMHQPWSHATEANAYRGRPLKRFDKQLEESLSTASDLESIATQKRIPIREPFAGIASADENLIVLGPSEDYYNVLVAQFEKPEKAQLRYLVERLLRKAKQKLTELWDWDALVEPDVNATRPQNNSSAIILAYPDDCSAFLFTGDAGVPALERAIPVEFLPLIKDRRKYIQLPHHGSKRNVGPAILDRMLGQKMVRGFQTGITAFISAAEDGEPAHPSTRVTNAAVRRGATVIATQGKNHVYMSTDRPMRNSYGPITPIPFCHEYDEE